MKKYILGTLGLLAVLLLLVVVPNTLSHKNIVITKEVTINSSKENVYDMISHLEQFPKWSPFIARDPGQKYQIKGNDGNVGASFHWEGDSEETLGYQTITKVVDNSYVKLDCTIEKPFPASPSFQYSLTESPNGVLVTQEFKVESPFVGAMFMWIFGARDKMATTNEHGLALLKKAVESRQIGANYE